MRAGHLHDPDRFNADPYYLSDETHDVARIILAVWVAGDATARVGVHLILVDHPIEGGAVAEAILECFGRDAGESERGIDGEPRLFF